MKVFVPNETILEYHQPRLERFDASSFQLGVPSALEQNQPAVKRHI